MNDTSNLDGQIAQALLEAAEYRNGADNVREVVVKRKGRDLFTFKIGSLDENGWQKCRRQNLKNKGKRNEELDNARFLSQVIYEATDTEDKERIWKNHDAWEQLDVASGVDLINKVLTPAEKARIAEEIGVLGGFEDDLDELIKN